MLEGEVKHLRTAQNMRMYDIRGLTASPRCSRSRNEIELDEADGTTRIIHRSESCALDIQARDGAAPARRRLRRATRSAAASTAAR